MTTGNGNAGFEDFLQEEGPSKVLQIALEDEKIPIWIIIGLFIGVIGLIALVVVVLVKTFRNNRLDQIEAIEGLKRDV